jgi:hypothetical protein
MVSLLFFLESVLLALLRTVDQLLRISWNSLQVDDAKEGLKAIGDFKIVWFKWPTIRLWLVYCFAYICPHSCGCRLNLLFFQSYFQFVAVACCLVQDFVKQQFMDLWPMTYPLLWVV